MNIKIKNLCNSKKICIAITAILALVLMLIIFQAGMFIGYKKANFSGRFVDNYYRNFEERRHGNMMFFSNPMYENLPNGYGAVGKIIKLDSSSLIVSDSSNIEKVILLDKNTEIRKFRDSISVNDLKIDDFIVVIGTPNEQGQIVAKLIRVMPYPPETSTGTSTNKTL